MIWRFRRGALFCTAPRVMGILNVTPDSFFDGGRYNSPAAAAARAAEMTAEGADIIDMGAQSTRPGAALLSAEEEWERLAPCLAAVLAATPLPLSIDTFHPAVAANALEAGAHILNDVSGGRENRMPEVAAEYGAGMVFMRPGDPARRDVPAPRVLAETAAYFRRALALADRAGLPREAVCLDPGIGFGSSREGDLALIAGLPGLLTDLPPVPVLVGASRKRVTAEIGGEGDRLAATLALHGEAVKRGAHILRVHDVAHTVKALKAIRAVEEAEVWIK